MKLYVELCLLLLIMQDRINKPNQSENTVLVNILNSMGFGEHLNTSKEGLITRLLQIENEFRGRINYYRQSNLEVNKVLTGYLFKLVEEAEDGLYHNLKDIAMIICSLGNKTHKDLTEKAVYTIVDNMSGILDLIIERGRDGEPNDRFLDATRGLVHRLEYYERILQLVDTFVTCRNGAIAGLEEYAPVDQAFLHPVPEPDFRIGNECLGDENCDCGCSLNHTIMVAEGMEDYLNNRETSASAYFYGVMAANDYRLSSIQGNEGKVFDAIKEMGEKAYNYLKESFDAFLKNFEPKEVAEKADGTVEVGENNKKALQAMEDKNVAINDAAKKGIEDLAAKAFPEGEMGTIVSSLKTPVDAPKVIDALLGLLNKKVAAASEVEKAVKEAKSKLDDLKKATNDASKGDEENKDVVAANKEQVNEKIKQAKEALKKIKEEMAKHKTGLDAIHKAVSGINPKIFSKKEKDEGN